MMKLEKKKLIIQRDSKNSDKKNENQNWKEKLI
jgi:hypothetical protein